MGSGLRRLRRMLDLDQREVGARLGITPQAYSHWENGRTELRASDLIRLSYALGVPLGTLMRFLDMPIEDRVLTQGQWEDSGRPAPTPPPSGWRLRAPVHAQSATTSGRTPGTTFGRDAATDPPDHDRGAIPPGYRAA